MMPKLETALPHFINIFAQMGRLGQAENRTPNAFSSTEFCTG